MTDYEVERDRFVTDPSRSQKHWFKKWKLRLLYLIIPGSVLVGQALIKQQIYNKEIDALREIHQGAQADANAIARHAEQLMKEELLKRGWSEDQIREMNLRSHVPTTYPTNSTSNYSDQSR